MQKVSVIRPILSEKTLDPQIKGTEHPGTYRWWFHEQCLKDLDLSNTNLKSTTIDGELYFALYFGIAVKETIRQRLNWHINQNHSTSNMKSGTISTLRLSLCALLLQNNLNKTILNSESVVNSFIDNNCIVEWMPYALGTESQIRSDELYELAQSYWYPLNIQNNKKNDSAKLCYYKKLKRLRSRVKKELLSSI